jgi:hypothetical protein
MADLTVYVVGGDSLIEKMFNTTEGYKTVGFPEQADMFCFIGGADVHPSLYNEAKLPGTSCSIAADERDQKYFKLAEDKFKVGICRGGQFLNVMNGGRMYQHVDNHTGTHKLIDFLITKREVEVTSTHHQMMIPDESGLLLAGAQLARNFCTAEYPSGVPDNMRPKWDTEVVWYDQTKSLCFQPHPEYQNKSCYQYFFDVLDDLLWRS